MADAKRPARKAPEPTPRFFDEEERELVESFEAALERGEIRQSAAELASAQLRWKEIASQAHEAVSLKLESGDLDVIKAVARRKGVSHEALISALVHEFALGAEREAD